MNNFLSNIFYNTIAYCEKYNTISYTKINLKFIFLFTIKHNKYNLIFKSFRAV